MAEQDLESELQATMEYEDTVIELLVPPDFDDAKDAIIECSCGAGGQESMLFTAEIFDLYRNFSAFKGWNFEQLDVDFDATLGTYSANRKQRPSFDLFNTPILLKVACDEVVLAFPVKMLMDI